MVILFYIFSSIGILTLIGGILSMIIVCGAEMSTTLQYLYLRFFTKKKDWRNYAEMNKYIDSGHSIPIVELHDFVHMQCDPKLNEKYSEFISHNPYYFLIFDRSGKPELCGYRTTNNEIKGIILSAFYQKLCLKMAYKMGYTYDNLCTMLKDGLARDENRHIENVLRINESETSLKELRECRERLNEKQNNTSI